MAAIDVFQLQVVMKLWFFLGRFCSGQNGAAARNGVFDFCLRSPACFKGLALAPCGARLKLETLENVKMAAIDVQ
jgi:hypothetical protein